ncbi:hypothetical protein SBI_03729 [Streptomyces bingchenggensis BCW-1]|uniref:Aromatic ring-opening dioxygenase LigA n=1 Tax=Streptomyces bingchenggensis (strain BCW-1) TaxID=749414 RepID=D7CFU2_STRBB|nr:MULTISPECIES: hypothetical protein [Streptomyces]ADI06850.1 hypothetical protein SBI_03729 [Streptomyces bingchenggensis BCW-1]
MALSRLRRGEPDGEGPDGPEGGQDGESPSGWLGGRLTRRRAWGLAAAVVALAALAGTVVWFAGSDDRALDDACDGVLAKDEVRAVLGDGEISVSNRTKGTFDAKAKAKAKAKGGSGGDGANTLAVRCEVTADGKGSVKVNIEAGPRPRTTYGIAGMYTPLPERDTLAVPLGHGWSGVFGTDNVRQDDNEDGEGTAAVLLECGKGGTSLLITVETELSGVTLDDPAVRPDFVRTATATAKAANDHWGCGASLGKPVRTVGLPVNEDEYEPLLGADGTCAGVPTAARSAVSTARETARDRAPREACALGARDGSPRYRLDAYYGPYAEETRAEYSDSPSQDGPTPADEPSGRLGQSAYWASASCPDGAEDALFLVRADGTEDDTRRKPDLTYERAALKAFAERSAQHHGCEAPTTPAG